MFLIYYPTDSDTLNTSVCTGEYNLAPELDSIKGKNVNWLQVPECFASERDAPGGCSCQRGRFRVSSLR